VFYSPAPVIHTEDLQLVRELFAEPAPVMLVAGKRHRERIEAALGRLARLWRDAGRRQAWGNRPPP
jgi:hypothetical protein